MIERKKFDKRIEDYVLYKRRKYCDHECYVAMKKKKAAIPPPPEPTKAEMREQIDRDMKEAELIEELTPLDFLIREMNRPSNSLSYRKECAALAAPYCHPKLDAKTSKTKKEERAETASRVAADSKFAPAPPPSKIVGRIG